MSKRKPVTDEAPAEVAAPTPLMRQITDVIQARIGIAPKSWSRVGAEISPWIKDDGERVLTGVIAFIEWYNSSVWRLAERPLTGSVFLEKFSDWYASWRVDRILTLPKDDADFVVPGPEFTNPDLKFSEDWFSDYFSLAIFNALQLDVFSTRFVAFRFRIKEKLPRFQSRHKAMDFTQGFTAILLSTEFAWIVRDQNLDSILRNYESIVAALTLATSVTYTEFR